MADLKIFARTIEPEPTENYLQCRRGGAAR